MPCSGKSTSEVDVEILIHISGLVPAEEPTPLTILDSGDASAAGAGGSEDADDSSADSSSGEAVKAATTGGSDSDTSTAPSTNQTSAAAASAEEALRNLMQSDQEDSSSSSSSSAGQRQQQQPAEMKKVSYMLTIKRKKICTMHPVPVQPNTYPPTQSTQRPVLPPQPQSHINSNNNKWPIQSQPAEPVVSFLQRISISFVLCCFCVVAK